MHVIGIEIYFAVTDYIPSFKADLSKLAKDSSDFTVVEFCPGLIIAFLSPVLECVLSVAKFRKHH